MALWFGLMTGRLDFAASYGPVAWHAHEFLFGYVAAIVGGFLLTAIPNWTGRLPVHGGALLALFVLWAAGRVALIAVDMIGPLAAATVDSLFLSALAAVVLREIIAGRNLRNVKVAALLTLLAATNVLFHVEVVTSGMANYAMRTGIAVIVSLIMLIGGRITPSFTHNWLVRQGSERLPAPSGRFDTAAFVMGGAALFLWVAMPETPITGTALVIAGLIQAVRLSRWAGTSAWREPLVLVLHIGFGFVPLGFVLVGSSVLWPATVLASAALHAWTAGAMGLMTLAVMTRASLGHTGRALTATPGTQAIYVAATLAALSRIVAPFVGDLSFAMLVLGAAAWTAAFAAFVFLYGPMLLQPKLASP
jgi:uncharacterized protein involved in response to NO